MNTHKLPEMSNEDLTDMILTLRDQVPHLTELVNASVEHTRILRQMLAQRIISRQPMHPTRIH